MSQQENLIGTFVTLDLLAQLNKVFPERSAVAGDDLPGLMFAGGQRSVVNFLRERFNAANTAFPDQKVFS